MDRTPRILSLSTRVPEHRWTQEEILDVLAQHFPLYGDRRVRRLVRQSGIDTRHFAIAKGAFDPTASADDLHAHYASNAVDLGAKAGRGALAEAGLDASDIDCLVATTCTGYVCPGLSARLGLELGMRDDLQRADLVGMGCAGAMPSLQRAHDFVRAYPERRALVVAVEIASACFFVDDSLETVVGNTICADGAAGVVVGTGAEGPRLERFSTHLDRSFLDAVGLEFTGGKHRIVLSKDLRTAAGPLVRSAVDRLLADEGASLANVDHWVIHSGGKKVLDGIDASLDLAEGQLAHSRAVLRDCGNMSAPTLLFVLEKALRDARSGELGVLVALGPGLAAETGSVRF